jgi:hypothetical protein
VVEDDDMGYPADDGATTDPLERIRIALRGLRYGTVTAVVQDGCIVQVERTEKIRLERRETRGA